MRAYRRAQERLNDRVCYGDNDENDRARRGFQDLNRDLATALERVGPAAAEEGRGTGPEADDEGRGLAEEDEDDPRWALLLLLQGGPRGVAAVISTERRCICTVQQQAVQRQRCQQSSGALQEMRV